ncbi:hypothetical protein C1645_814644, partial [Glomus cerebriforme]
IPPHCSPVEILGDKKFHLNRIAQLTSSLISFNKDKSRIEMWGKSEDLEEAVKQWDALVDDLLVRKKRKKRDGWEKPEKAPLNKKQEAKMKRRKEREAEQNKYKIIPEGNFPYNGHFIIPDTTIDIERFIGVGGVTLDSIRTNNKCYIWHEPKHSLMKIVGEDCDSVKDATLQVKYLFTKVFAFKDVPDLGWVHHMIDPPSKPHKIRIADPPSWFYPPYDESDFKLLEPVFEGDKIPIVGKDDSSKELKQSFNLDVIQKIRESNLIKIKEALLKSLESIHLLDEEIKMRIRFGHVCLTRFPQPKASSNDSSKPKPLWAIERFNEKVMKNPRILSKFATCLAIEDSQLNLLFEDLGDPRSEDSQRINGTQLITDQSRDKYKPEPFREFKIYANRIIPNGNGTNESYPCTFDIEFEKFRCDEKKDEIKYIKSEREYDGRIGLWSAVLGEKNILNISMACLDNVYSWKLTLKTARRLSNDKFGAQGNFIYKLRFCKQGRLVYSNTKEINVVSVCEKTKWKYWWHKDYIVEITKYEFWDLSEFTSTPPGIEIPLSQRLSPTVTYGVTLYKKSWDDNFSHNCNLEPGEVPVWYPHDFIEGDEEEKGDVNDLLDDIGKFIRVLQDKLKTPMPTEHQ